MNVYKNISLAYYNLIHKSKYSVKMISSLLLILLIINFTALFIMGIEKYYNKLVVDNEGKNNISFEWGVSDDGVIADRDWKMLEQIRTIPGVGEPMIYADMDIRKNPETDSGTFLASKRVTIVQEDTNDLWAGKSNAPITVCYLATSGSYFAESDKKRFSYYYPEEKLMIIGEENQEYGDVVVSEEFVTNFGIENYENILNKNISLLVDGEMFLENIRVTGVYNSKISEIDATEYYSPFIYCGELSDIEFFPIQKLSVCAPLDNFMVGKQVAEYLERLNLSSKVYFDEEQTEILVYINRIKQLLYYIITFVMFFVMVALFLSLCGVLYSRIQENTPYYAMMRAVGMKKNDLLSLLFAEQLLLLSVAAFFSLPFVSSGLVLVNYLLQNVLKESVGITFFDFVRINSGCYLVMFIALIIVTVTFLFANQKKEISVLLKR